MATVAVPTTGIRELTVRGVILGGLITVLFTAANVYLGLRIGITFATSIPAAVISMAILRFFQGATIQENNIVQTIASAAGTLSAIIFVLPGLVMVGWWTGFPFWLSVAVIAIGGILGVMYSVPLRRALVTGAIMTVAIRGDIADVRAGGALHVTGVDSDGALIASRRSAGAETDAPQAHPDAPTVRPSAGAPHAEVTAPVHARDAARS